MSDITENRPAGMGYTITSDPCLSEEGCEVMEEDKRVGEEGRRSSQLTLS